MAIVETSYSETTSAGVMFRVKEAWKADGDWTVLESSDGTTYASGDVITHSGAGAGGFANLHAWLRIADPDGVGEWLFHRYGSATQWTFQYSPLLKFVATTPTATFPPSADDVIDVSNGQFDFSYPNNIALVVGVSDAAPWIAYFHGTSNTATNPDIFLFSVPVDGGEGDNPTIITTSFVNETFAVTYNPAIGLNMAALLDSLGGGGGGGGPTDTTPPVVSAFTPASGSTTTRTASIAVDVTDETALGSVRIWGVLADGHAVLVYDGSAFVGAFAAGSTLVGNTYTIAHTAPGWPSSTVAIHVVAVDAAGNDVSAIGTFTISNPPAAPAVGNFSPVDGGTTTRAGTATIDVTDDEGRAAIALVIISAELDDGTTRTVYNGSSFAADFATGSSRSNITNGYRYTIVANAPGWPSATIAFRISAVDAQGRVSTSSTYNLTITDPPDAPDPPDVAAPTVALVSPAAGSAMARTDPIVIDVTDASGFAALFVWVTYADGRAPELVHETKSFVVPFVGSTRVSISGGYRYTLRRVGGWPAAPTVHVRPVDAKGNTP